MVKTVPLLNVLEFTRYNHSMNTQTVEKCVEYFRKGTSIYRSKKDVTAYLTIIEPKEGLAEIGEE